MGQGRAVVPDVGSLMNTFPSLVKTGGGWRGFSQTREALQWPRLGAAGWLRASLTSTHLSPSPLPHTGEATPAHVEGGAGVPKPGELGTPAPEDS